MIRDIKLLTPPNAQPKLIKNKKVGMFSSALHLAPADLSGYEVCPGRSPQCTAACIHFAGNPIYFDRKTKARIKRTKWYFEDRPAFLTQLRKEIASLRRAALKRGLKPAVRLNATSDIPWERIAPELFSEFSDVSFYDYTAVISRLRRPLPINYHLTFSLKEDNLPTAIEALSRGFNVAVVFSRGGLPTAFELGGRTLAVVDGDAHDYRPADPSPCVVGLLIKGQEGRKLRGGFVHSPTPEVVLMAA